MLVRLGRQHSIRLRDHDVDLDDPAVHNEPADHDNDPADHDDGPADHYDCACPIARPIASYCVRERGGGAHRRR
jgi:hypothetical protein